MDSSWSEPLEQINWKDDDYLVMRLFQLLWDGEIRVSEEHEQLISNHRTFMKTNSDSSVEATGLSQDTSSLSVSGTGHSQNVDIINIAAGYVNKENEWGKTLLHLATKTADAMLVDVLIKAGAHVDAGDKFEKTPMHHSAKSGSTTIVESLLMAGANVNVKDKAKKTPLHYSAENGHKEVVESLLKAGVKINCKAMDKNTPLHLSAQNGFKELVEVLLKAGAKVEAENVDKQTPLHNSAKSGYTDVVEAFLKAGANVDAEDTYKQTPLHLSAMNGHTGVIETLLKAGANVDAEDTYKQTPLHLSAMNGHTGVVGPLLKAGANGNAKDQYKKTPLHISVDSKHDNFADLLLQAGASVMERDNSGYSVLDYMDDRQRIRFGFQPRKLFKLRNWMYSVTNNKKHVDSLTSSKTKTKRTETISATFTDYEESHTVPFVDSRPYPIEDSRNANDQDETSRDRSTLFTSRPQLRRSSVTSPAPDESSRPTPPEESHDLDDEDLEELNNIKRQVENHMAKFSLQTTDTSGMGCSPAFKAALQAGRILMPTTINITHNKITKSTTKIKLYYEPDTSFDMSHTENVAPGDQVVVNQNTNLAPDDDESSCDNDSQCNM